MNSRERSLTAINHQEQDRIPFDLGGSAQSGIHVVAYSKLRKYLGLPEVTVGVRNLIGQTPRMDEDFLDKLKVDTRFIQPRPP